MAELCVKCFRQECEEMGEPFAERGLVISKDSDLCETCGEIKPVVVRYKKLHFLYLLIDRMFIRKSKESNLK